MHCLKLTVAYDGTRYSGWQKQREKNQPSIQGTLEAVLQQVLQEPIKITGSGRTDAGVHALGQVAHVKVKQRVDLYKLQGSLLGLLPPDIAVMQIEDAEPDFHARYGAQSKRYRYRIFTGPVADPFIRPFVHTYSLDLNLALMKRETEVLLGEHDFVAFARSRHQRKTTVRRILDVSWARKGQELWFEVEGNGFLYMMVRSLVGTLLDIGRGHLPEGHMEMLLRTGERKLAGDTAPAQGLVLVNVIY